MAAWYGHQEVAELLIEKGAEIDAKDNDGKTPLDWAKEKNKKGSDQAIIYYLTKISG